MKKGILILTMGLLTITGCRKVKECKEIRIERRDACDEFYEKQTELSKQLADGEINKYQYDAFIGDYEKECEMWRKEFKDEQCSNENYKNIF